MYVNLSVSEQSKRSEAERCGASERCKGTNIASDRVALSKRDFDVKKQALNVRPDTQPISSRVWVGRGTNADGQGY